MRRFADGEADDRTRGCGHLCEGLVGQGGPAVGVFVRDGDPLLERPRNA